MRYIFSARVTQGAEPDHMPNVLAQRRPASAGGLLCWFSWPFSSPRGGPLHENTYGRAGHAVLTAALGPEAAPLPSWVCPGNYGPGVGSPAVPVWLIAPCSCYGLGGVAPGTAGA